MRRHRFSNTKRTRDWVAGRLQSKPLQFKTWEAIPLHFRLLVLEHISLTVEEVLRGQKV